MKYNKIAFLGMMGSGKTTVSKSFSKLCHIELFDLDYIFENHKDKLTEITKRDDKDLSYVDYFLREIANRKDRKKIEKHFLTFIKQL